MQYLLLIYTDEKEWLALSDEERKPITDEYFALTDSLTEDGSYVAGAPLQPTTTATSVRVRDGETLVTDGPFAETKEQLGGYYLVEAADADEAISIAARIPAARNGTIEVRPLLPVPARQP
jgi:hypothetical protein